MYKIIASLLIASLATGCAQSKPSKDNPIKECEGSNGKDVTIKYGDSYIDVTYKVNVKQDEKIVLKLAPQNNAASGKDYKALDIQLIGENKKDEWLNRTLNANDGSKRKIICVDDEAVGEYKYIVKVPGVGQIDPRVQVLPN
jgi:hypothetical protein